MQTVIVYGRKMEQSGGVENYIYNTYKRLNSDKFYLILIIPYLEDEKSLEMIKYKEIFNEVVFIESHTKSLYKHIKQLSHIFIKNKQAIVHIHASNGFHSINGLIAKLMGIKKIIYHSHNSSGLESKSIKLSRYIYEYSGTYFLGCTEAAVEYLFGKKIIKKGNYEIAKNAIDSEKFSFSELSRIKIRDEFSISNDTLFMGYVGRLSKEKNILFLLELLEQMISLNCRTKLLIVGNGPEEKLIRSYIDENNLSDFIIMAGVRTDINEIMSGLDLFLLPSEFEALGIVLIEAQTSGLKCLASSKVSRESKISNLIDYVNLEVSEWIQKIESINFNYSRNGFSQLTKQSGYDLSSSVLSIENIYDKL